MCHRSVHIIGMDWLDRKHWRKNTLQEIIAPITCLKVWPWPHSISRCSCDGCSIKPKKPSPSVYQSTQLQQQHWGGNHSGVLSSFIDWLMGKGGGSVCGKLSRGQQATVSANQHRSISSVLVHDGSIRAHTMLTTAADAVFICLYYIFIRGNNYIYFSFLKTNCRIFSEKVSGVRKKKSQ